MHILLKLTQVILNPVFDPFLYQKKLFLCHFHKEKKVKLLFLLTEQQNIFGQSNKKKKNKNLFFLKSKYFLF